MYELLDGKYGRRMVLHGVWKSEYGGVIASRNVAELELNYAHGWVRSDLSFLRGLPELKCLELTDWNINDVSEVHALQNLRRLQISTYCKTEIDARAFPYLGLIHFMWVDFAAPFPSFLPEQWNCFRSGGGNCGQPLQAVVQGEVGKSVWRWSGELHCA